MLPLIFIPNFKQEHIASCKFKKIPCPNKQYGCTELLLQSQWEEHLERECRFIPVQCPWCSKKGHNKDVRKLLNLPSPQSIIINIVREGYWSRNYFGDFCLYNIPSCLVPAVTRHYYRLTVVGCTVTTVLKDACESK